MKVKEMRKLPGKAGVATLEWFLRDDRLPSIKGSVIRLPEMRDDAYFYPLKDGEQFLFWLGDFDLNEPDRFDHVYFGGTDETPFLVSLKPQALLSFLNGGEASFFEVLRPWIIQRLQLIWGKDKTRRQGNIFAYPMPYDWDKLVKKWNDNITGSMCSLDRDCNGRELFGTSHQFLGKLYQGDFWLDGIGRFFANRERPLTDGTYPIILGEGVIKTADHKELELKGLHLIAQAALLIS